MQSTFEHIESLVSKAGELAETKVELWKLRAVGKISKSVSSIISKVAIVVLLAIALIMISLGAAYWLGSAMNNTYYGFFIMGGFYALVGLFVFLFRRNLIKKPLSDLIIDKIIK